MSSVLRYAVVTPARDEAARLVALATSIAQQDTLPDRWVIVDNGSTDETASVAAKLADRHPWVRFTSTDGDVSHVRGGPVVRAFQTGLNHLDEATSFVAKVDADVTFDADYFSSLLTRFAEEPQLGIASGGCYERAGGTWRARHTTEPNVWGAARLYRCSCLDSLLPLDARMGWDAIDVLRANVAGWTTRTFDNIPFWHHRVEAERDGARHRRWLKQGQVAHYLRYRPTYLLLRTLHQARTDRTAPALLWGFILAAARRQERCAEAAVVAHVRSQQRLRHVRRRAVEALGGSEPGSSVAARSPR